jgi:hypothetical protein
MGATRRDQHHRAGRNRHERRALAKRGRQQVFELKLVDTWAPEDVNEARAVESVLSKIASDAPPLCMCCDATLTESRPPTSVMVVRPFAMSTGHIITGGVCANCDARGFTFVKAGCIAQFRTSGFMPDAREAQAGRA